MSLNHFLHGLSASLNLIIISITGSKFRKTLVKLFGPKSAQQENEIKQKKFACKKTTKISKLKMLHLRITMTLYSLIPYKEAMNYFFEGNIVDYRRLPSLQSVSIYKSSITKTIFIFTY